MNTLRLVDNKMAWLRRQSGWERCLDWVQAMEPHAELRGHAKASSFEERLLLLGYSGGLGMAERRKHTTSRPNWTVEVYELTDALVERPQLPLYCCCYAFYQDGGPVLRANSVLYAEDQPSMYALMTDIDAYLARLNSGLTGEINLRELVNAAQR